MRNSNTFGWRSRLVPALTLMATLLAGGAARAQEDNFFSPPPPLQFPTLARADATGVLPMSAIRRGLELAGDAELCKILTREEDPDAVFPPDFTFAQCGPAIAARVRGRSGSVRWASGARPSECGGGCVGRPIHGRTFSLDRPNRRFASVFARLTFTVVNAGPTPFDRDVIFPVEVRVECRIEGGRTAGEIRLNSVTSPPFADEPGFAESFFDFLLGPANISRSIDDGIRAALAGGGMTPGPSLGACTSIGARQDPQDPVFDSFVWDVPPPRPRLPATVSAVPGTTATVVFDSIVRHPTTETSPPAAEPLQFLVYINGNPALIPRIGTLDLPPGGRHDQRYCRTVDVAGAEALQILFIDNLGGTVWSQFPEGIDLGTGRPRTMTTGRQFFEAPRPIEGVPDLPGGDKPQAFIAREFEVRYHVEFQPLVVAPTPVPGGGLHGGTHVPVDGGIATADTAPPPPPCVRI